MQKYEEIKPLSPVLPKSNEMIGNDLEDGGFCVTTRRIIIISPLPASLHSLVSELTAQCYDVMLFHHADNPMISTIQADLFLIDRTKGMMEGKKAPAINGKIVPSISLVSEKYDPGIPGEETLIWPCPIEAVLDKIRGVAEQNARLDIGATDQLQFKDIVLDLKRMAASRSGVRIDLTKTEFDLLKVLLRSDGRALPRQEMMDLVWGDQYFGGSNSVDVHIKSLRHKLEDNPKNPTYIATVRGIGYRLAD